MGEIADMILEGMLCAGCGVALEDSLGEFAQYCPSCQREAEEDEIPTKKKSKKGRK